MDETCPVPGFLMKTAVSGIVNGTQLAMESLSNLMLAVHWGIQSLPPESMLLMYGVVCIIVLHIIITVVLFCACCCCWPLIIKNHTIEEKETPDAEKKNEKQ